MPVICRQGWWGWRGQRPAGVCSSVRPCVTAAGCRWDYPTPAARDGRHQRRSNAAATAPNPATGCQRRGSPTAQSATTPATKPTRPAPLMADSNQPLDPCDAPYLQRPGLRDPYFKTGTSRHERAQIGEPAEGALGNYRTQRSARSIEEGAPRSTQPGLHCLLSWSFSRSFHRPQLNLTRPDSPETPPNLTWPDPTEP
jgi:hypothetical protein